MHRTQLYFDEDIFAQAKQRAQTLGVSVSAYIRDLVRQDLEDQSRAESKIDFSEFAGMWENRDIDQLSLRKKAWK